MTDAPNPDPAVFEAAFVLDDSDDPSRTGTPKPAPPEKDAPDTAKDGLKPDAAESDGKDAPMAELSPEIRQRLRKLEKLEATYPGELVSNGVMADDRTPTLVSRGA